jgi:NitT/TauT family transport system permease protein
VIRKSISTIGVPVLVALGILALWQIAALSLDIDGLPTVGAAFGAIPDILSDPKTIAGLAASLTRMLVGFSIAVVFGVSLGLMMGRSAAMETAANPLLMIFYPVPKAALMPIIMLWLGIGDMSKTLVIILGVSLPVIYHTFQGARSVEVKMLWSAAAMGDGRFGQLFRVVLPAALPEIFVGLRTGIVLAFITMVTSEMIVRQTGIGNVLFNALDTARYDAVYATIVIISVIGLACDSIFERIRFWVLRWSSETDELAVGSA